MARGGARPGAGRPKGSKNKVTEEKRKRLADLAQEYTSEAVTTLAEVMRDTEAPHAARVNAATAMLDRGHGKPVQTTEVSGPDGGPIQTQTTIDPAKLDDDTLAKLMAAKREDSEA